MQSGALEIGSRLSLDAAEPMIVDAFASQRRRLLETARSLTDDEWTRPTRCSEWNAHELVLHVAGATDACRMTLTGQHSVFGGSFDPNTSPKAFVALLAGQSVATTLDQLDHSTSGAREAIDAERKRVPAKQVTAVWGEEVDWRLFVTHFFWDAWMHERDLFVPLGRQPDTSDAEARLAVAYGLHTAAIVVGLFGIPFDTRLSLTGRGEGTYRIVVDGVDVRIAVTPIDRVGDPDHGDATAVTDAIAGRGPALASVLDAPAEVVEPLSAVGDFLRG